MHQAYGPRPSRTLPLYGEFSLILCHPYSRSGPKFIWPPIVDDAMVLTPAQLALLLEAIDWRRTVAVAPPRRPVVA
jgi:transposase